MASQPMTTQCGGDSPRRAWLTDVLALAAVAFVGTGAGSVAWAHGEKVRVQRPAGPPEQKDWGIAGDRRRARRRLDVRMSDRMRFSPAHIDVAEGETVRLVIHNDGKLMHEFVIGTRAENERHAAWMVQFPNMEHDEPYMAHVAPGRRGEIVWTFNRPGTFEFACLIAGHYPAGMVGTIRVLPNPSDRRS